MLRCYFGLLQWFKIPFRLFISLLLPIQRGELFTPHSSAASMLYVSVTGSLCIANCVFKNALVPQKKLRIIITHHKGKWILTRVIYQHHQQTVISCLQITRLTIWSLSTLFPSPLVTFALSVTDQGNLMQVNSSLACEQTQAAPLYVWQNGECTPLCHFHSDMRQVISRLVMVSYESCRETPAAGSRGSISRQCHAMQQKQREGSKPSPPKNTIHVLTSPRTSKPR